MNFAKPPISFENVEFGKTRTASAFETIRFTLFTSMLRVTELFAHCGYPRYCYLQNTLQASLAVRRHDAQTGGFIFLWKALHDIRLKNPADQLVDFVGCCEARTASCLQSMWEVHS